MTKKLTGRFQQTDKPVKDKNGNQGTAETMGRWAEYFRELMNHPNLDSPPDISSTETELPINCDKLSKAEIKKAVMTLRSGKAAGPNEIPAEVIKADKETAVNILYNLFSKIWEKEEVPAQWTEGIIIKLPKKEDLRDCRTIEGSCSCQHSQHGSTGEDKGGCRPKVPRPAGRLPAKQILCRPDRQPAHHRGTVTEVELPLPPPPTHTHTHTFLHQIYRLWERLRHCRQRDNLEATETQWNPRKDNLPHPVHLPGQELQDCPRRPAA